MLSSAYYRRQADICLGMALAAGGDGTAEGFRALALEFLAKATEAEGVTGDVVQGSNPPTQSELRRE